MVGCSNNEGWSSFLWATNTVTLMPLISFSYPLCSSPSLMPRSHGVKPWSCKYQKYPLQYISITVFISNNNNNNNNNSKNGRGISNNSYVNNNGCSKCCHLSIFNVSLVNFYFLFFFFFVRLPIRFCSKIILSFFYFTSLLPLLLFFCLFIELWLI